MKRLVAFAVEGAADQEVIVEVDEPVAEGGEELASRVGKVAVAEHGLEESLARVRPAADCLMRTLRGLAVSPDEATIEFGIKLSGRAGAVIASAAAEANFTVTLRWQSLGDSSQDQVIGEGTS
jgi:Trypsin-co-occurring domain 1